MSVEILQGIFILLLLVVLAIFAAAFRLAPKPSQIPSVAWRIVTVVLVPTIWRRIIGRPVEHDLICYVFANAKEGDAESVMNTIDQFCQKDWMMNVGDDKGKIVDKVVKETDPTVILEYGGYCGYSAVRIGRLLRDDALMYSIEINPVYAAISTKIIEFAGLSNKVKVVVGTPENVLPKLKEKFGIKFVDLVFIDHAKERYLPDAKMTIESGLLHRGSVLVADNVIVPGNPEYLKYIRSHPNFQSTFHESNVEYLKNITDGIEVSRYI